MSKKYQRLSDAAVLEIKRAIEFTGATTMIESLAEHAFKHGYNYAWQEIYAMQDAIIEKENEKANKNREEEK